MPLATVLMCPVHCSQPVFSGSSGRTASERFCILLTEILTISWNDVFHCLFAHSVRTLTVRTLTCPWVWNLMIAAMSSKSSIMTNTHITQRTLTIVLANCETGLIGKCLRIRTFPARIYQKTWSCRSQSQSCRVQVVRRSPKSSGGACVPVDTSGLGHRSRDRRWWHKSGMRRTPAHHNPECHTSFLKRRKLCQPKYIWCQHYFLRLLSFDSTNIFFR